MRALLAGLLVCLSAILSTATAQDTSPIATIRALNLDSTVVDRITVHFDRPDGEHALDLAALCAQAAAFFNAEFDASFAPHLAVLRPEHWFVPYAGPEGEPYGIPWGWIPDRLIVVPASLDEGVLISGSDRAGDLRRVQFVMLHEYGHLASKEFLHPNSSQPYTSVRWFNELVATYFAYAFVRANDGEWARSAADEWRNHVDSFTPPVVSLDWSHLLELPPAEFAQTYGWYQYLLNVKAADLYEEHGLGLLYALRDSLDWADSANWTNDELMPILDGIAPGFKVWASTLGNDSDANVNADAETRAFEQAADTFQQLYIGGGENCEAIIATVADDVVLVENGETWVHAQLVEFCPHLPRKNVTSSWTDRTLLNPDLGYDFVTSTYENEPGEPRRETTVRVWRKMADEWRITRMSSVLSAQN